MSTGIKRPYATMKKLADSMVDRLAPACQRIEIAGSVRRKKDLCGDLEIVCIPDGRKLDTLLGSWMEVGKIHHTKPQRWGSKLKSFTFFTTDHRPLQVDVYAQTPETWGVNFCLRTGSAEFSNLMVTRRSSTNKSGRPGFMPDQYTVEDARVWLNGVPLGTPEEIDVFRLWGIEYIPPEQRTDFCNPVLGDPPVIEVESATLFDLG